MSLFHSCARASLAFSNLVYALRKIDDPPCISVSIGEGDTYCSIEVIFDYARVLISIEKDGRDCWAIATMQGASDRGGSGYMYEARPTVTGMIERAHQSSVEVGRLRGDE